MAYDQEKEKQEAVEAGISAIKSLRAAQDHLNRAKNWGVWDMLAEDFSLPWRSSLK